MNEITLEPGWLKKAMLEAIEAAKSWPNVMQPLRTLNEELRK